MRMILLVHAGACDGPGHGGAEWPLSEPRLRAERKCKATFTPKLRLSLLLLPGAIV